MTTALAGELTAELGDGTKVAPGSPRTIKESDRPTATDPDGTEGPNVAYISLGVAGVALVVLAGVAWSRRRSEN